jgi:hypothetical protein
VEELDKRIEELKAVQFWLDQNAMALKATIQALEVQKMTLATLKGMNFNMGDVANAFKLKAADTVVRRAEGHRYRGRRGGGRSGVAGAVTGVASAWRRWLRTWHRPRRQALGRQGRGQGRRAGRPGWSIRCSGGVR